MLPVREADTRAHEGGAAADVVGDEKRLAFQLETVCVKCLAEEPVSVHEQHVSWLRIHGARQDVKQTLLRFAIQRSRRTHHFDRCCQ